MYYLISDFGNTSIKIALVDDVNDSFLFIRSFKRINFFFRYLFNINKKYEIKSFTYCSVRGKETEEIIDKIKKIFNNNIEIDRIKYYKDSIFSFSYNPISSYGEDRLAILYYIAKNFPDKAVFAIDCGTAVNIETMINKKYTGGAIFPGINLLLKSLFNKTRQLPLIKSYEYLNKNEIDEFNKNPFGFSTKQCILSGLYNFYSSSIIAYFNSFCENEKNMGKIIFIITGGDSLLTYNLIKDKIKKYQIDENNKISENNETKENNKINKNNEIIFIVDENIVLKGLICYKNLIKQILNNQKENR